MENRTRGKKKERGEKWEKKQDGKAAEIYIDRWIFVLRPANPTF